MKNFVFLGKIFQTQTKDGRSDPTWVKNFFARTHPYENSDKKALNQ